MLRCTALCRSHHIKLQYYQETLDCTCCCVGLAADIAQYASKYKPDAMEDKKPLAMVMSLDSRYFPEELYTSKERK